MFNRILEGYGSFFALNHPASKLLIFLAAMLQPYSGMYGLLGGVTVLLARRLMHFQSESERIETVNGILLGMLIGSMYAPDYRASILTVGGAVLVVLVSAVLSDTLSRTYRLPLLGLPYAIASFILLPVAANLQLIPALPANTYYIPSLPPQAFLWLYPIGAIYFNGTIIGGMLVLAGFALSSRYLALLAVTSSLLCCGYLQVLGIPTTSTLFLVAQMNGVLSACIIAGLCATPGKRSLLVAAGAAIFACTLSLCLSRLLWIFELPVLALPFVMATYACMMSFTPLRGKAWTYFWLPVPCLAERSIEHMEVAKARGIDARSIALRSPLVGAWEIYQGVNGEHTHVGLWQYALDFFQKTDNRSFCGDGEALSDYYAFGKPVYAPAHGTVIDCRSDLIDNRPGEVDTVNNWGNFILLQLDSGPCVMLAHLQRNSVKVAPLTRVIPGQHLAACGNSGRSPQPHLHMHVQESYLLGSKTLPFHLTCVTTSGAGATGTPRFSLRACPKETEVVTAPRKNRALKNALRFVIGTNFQFEVERPRGNSKGTTGDVTNFEVKLDVYGQFWLESITGAKVAFTCNDDFVAFYSRVGPADEVLDALVLSLSLTPFAEGAISWSDLAPRRLLPMNIFTRFTQTILHPFKACTEATFNRTWDPITQLWTQTADHTISGTTWTTTAKLCEADGLVSFSLRQNNTDMINATLVGFGLREDNGIPECKVELPARTPA
jgi:urea transporter